MQLLIIDAFGHSSRSISRGRRKEYRNSPGVTNEPYGFVGCCYKFFLFRWGWGIGRLLKAV